VQTALSISQTKEDLENATSILVGKIKELIVPLKAEMERKMKDKINEGYEIGQNQILWLDSLFKYHNLKIIIPYWKQEAMFRIHITSGAKLASMRMRELLGLSKE